MITHIWSITLTVSDLDQAVNFYEGKLGLRKKYQFSDYAGLDCGGVEIGLKTWGEQDLPREGEPSIDFSVPDLDVAFQGLAAKGIKFIKEPEDVKWGARTALFQDPDGHILQLTEINWTRYFTVCASS